MQLVDSLIRLAALPASTTTAFQAQYPTDIAALIDDTVSPCEDFFEYACGRWIKNHPMPSKNRTEVGYSFDSAGDHNREVLLDIFRQDKSLLGQLFQSCMVPTKEADSKLVQAVRTQIASVRTKADLFKLAGQISSYGPNFLTEVSVNADLKDATRNVLVFGATRTDPLDEEDSDGSGFLKYVTNLFVLNGEDQPTASTHAANVVLLESQVNQFRTTTLRDDPSASYNPMSVDHASKMYPYTFGVALVDAFDLFKTFSVKPTDMVVVSSPSYADAVEKLIETTPLQALQVYLDYTYLNFAAKYLDQAFQDARFEFVGAFLRDQQTPSSRERECAQHVQKYFPDLVGKYFLQAKFSGQSEQLAVQMLELIENSMHTRLSQLDWLDPATRQEALTKLSHVENRIGGQSEPAENVDITLSATSFLSNMQAINLYYTKLALASINQPVDRNEWFMSNADVNAYYDRATNQMVFPAGILQPPFFRHDFDPAQNFGSIGVIMAHELIHGFDTTGRRFDGHGNLRDWWTSSTNAEFELRARCFVDQYSGFSLLSSFHPDVRIGNVDGQRTLGENLADNGGFGLAWDAFHAYLASSDREVIVSSSSSSSSSLQDMERTFFVSFAQTWCRTSTDGTAKQRLREDEHAPDRFRVIGVIQNSRYFGDLFECADKTFMNPQTKCQVW